MIVNQTNDVIKNRLLRLILRCKKRNEFFSLFGIFFFFSFFGFLVFFRVVIRRWRLRQLEPIPSRFFWRNCEVLLYFTTATSQFYSIFETQHFSLTLFFAIKTGSGLVWCSNLKKRWMFWGLFRQKLLYIEIKIISYSWKVRTILYWYHN